MTVAVQEPLSPSAPSPVSRGTADLSPAGRVARVGAAICVLAVTVAGCGDAGEASVRTGTVGRGMIVETVAAPAVVTAHATATVNAPADGTVRLLRAREGQQVRAGQVLLRVGSPEARRRLRMARQADARAATGPGPIGFSVPSAGTQPAAEAAQRAFTTFRRGAMRIPAGPARTQALSMARIWESQFVAARSATDQAARQLASWVRGLSQAITGLSSAQRVQTGAAVDVARRTVAALTVRAPVAGTVSLAPLAAGKSHSSDTSALVGKLPAGLQGQAGGLLGSSGSSSSVDAALTRGRRVSSGQPILTVTDASRLTLTAQVDETDVLLVKKGTTASATLDAVPDASYAATVTSIDPEPTTSSRGGVSYVARLSLGPGHLPDGSVAPTPRPGMSAVLQLHVRTARHAVVVPSEATFRDGRRDAVWVVKNGVARERLVRLGAQGKSRVQVVEGLEPGERIVMHGDDVVRDGEQVS